MTGVQTCALPIYRLLPPCVKLAAPDLVPLDCIANRTVRPNASGMSIARVQARRTPGTPGAICNAAQAARMRNSPVAPRLEAQCRAWEAAQFVTPPSITDKLAEDDADSRAAGLITGDVLFAAARELLEIDAERRGFDIGVRASLGQTEYGPNKQALHDRLDAAGQRRFRLAVSIALDRNRHHALADVGAGIALASVELTAARSTEADVRYWLGFDIATGIFGPQNREQIGRAHV